MRILNQLAVEEFKKKHPQSRRLLDNWLDIVGASKWKSIPELKAVFPSADYLAPHIVFNIGGNKFRLIAVVVFTQTELTVVKILTHAEYDRWQP